MGIRPGFLVTKVFVRADASIRRALSAIDWKSFPL